MASLKSTFDKAGHAIKEISEEPTPLVTTTDGRELVRQSGKEEDDTEVMTDFDIREEENLRAQLMQSRNRWIE